METKNPFAKAVVVARNTNPALYHDHTVRRGDPGFCMSRSELAMFNHNPRRWKAGFVFKQTEAMKWGSLLDTLVLQPKEFEKRYAVPPLEYPGTPRKKGDPVEMKAWTRQAKYCETWENERTIQGIEIVKASDLHQVQAAAARLLADEEIAALLKDADVQVLIHATYNDRDTGLTIPVKMLIDAVPLVTGDYGKGLADLKSSESGVPRKWRKSVFDYHYHWQAAMELDAYTLATGEDRMDFYHPMQENYFPYEVSRRFLSAEFIQLGRDQYTAALRRYAQCLHTGLWPGYDDPADKNTWRGWAKTDPEDWMLAQ